MFDFIRKRLNKTIKDASDSIPEEELESQEQENISEIESIDNNETDDENIPEDSEEKSEPESSEEESKQDEEESKQDEEERVEKKKSRFSFFKRDKKEEKKDDKEDESQEEKEIESSEDESEKDEEIHEDEDKQADESQEKETESEEIKEPEKSEEPEEPEEPEKEEEKTKKSRFSFFRRNKKEDKPEETKKEEKPEETKKEEKPEESKEEEKPEEKEEPEEEKGGMFSFITKKTIKEEDIEEILEELEFSLLEGDVAYDVADKIVESVKEDLVGRKISRRGDMELFTTNALKKAITEILDNGSCDLLANIQESKDKGEPYKIMFVGINGTGKTTTIAKIAKYLEKNGYSSVFGASDTFRAGAIEQLEHHANNLNLKIIKHERNSDPASVAFDAVEHAKATNKDVVLIDTSGRMQTNTNLMDEMKKIQRVSKPDFIMYVGDALMGNDATEQASKFNEVITIDGIILTKADADAKGGAALSIGHVINKPILFIGTGQSYDDLMEFKPEWMLNLIFGEEE